MLLEALYPLLTGNADLVTAASAGIYKVTPKQGGCLPALVYFGAGGSGNPTFNTPGMQRARVQFNGLGSTRGEAAAVLEALRKLLNGYVGTLDGGLRIQNALLINPEPIDLPLEEYARDFRCYSEYYFWFVFPD